VRQFLHSVWPLASVCALTVVLSLQIPSRALFFRPANRLDTVPFASCVVYDARAYEALVRKARMSWQVRARGVDPRAESAVDAIGLEEAPPAPDALALPADFFSSSAASPRAERACPLAPPSVADAAPVRPVAAPPDDAAGARALRDELLTLPESLLEQEKEYRP